MISSDRLVQGNESLLTLVIPEWYQSDRFPFESGIQGPRQTSLSDIKKTLKRRQKLESFGLSWVNLDEMCPRPSETHVRRLGPETQ